MTRPRRTESAWWIALALVIGPAGAIAAELKSVKLVDAATHQPLASIAVEITSQVVAQCIKAPCPTQSTRRWQGVADGRGVLRYPASLESGSALVYVHAVGSEFAADVHGEKKDRNGLPIVRLRRAAEVPKP